MPRLPKLECSTLLNTCDSVNCGWILAGAGVAINRRKGRVAYVNAKIAKDANIANILAVMSRLREAFSPVFIDGTSS